LRREGLPLDYHEPSNHSDEGKRLSRGKSGSDKSRKKKLSRKNSHRATKMGTKTYDNFTYHSLSCLHLGVDYDGNIMIDDIDSKSSKGKKNGTLKKTKSGAKEGRGLGGRKQSSVHDEKKEAPKAPVEPPRHRSLHSIRVMKRQQSQAGSAAMSGSGTDGTNNALAAGVAAHKELMAANAIGVAASSGGSAAKYVSGGGTLPTGGSSASGRGSPTPVLGDGPALR
jgi:hypothetical protein